MNTPSQAPDRPPTPELNLNLGSLPDRMFVLIRSLTLAMEGLHPYLFRPESFKDTPMPPEVIKSASDSFQIICSRLDNLVVESANWNTRRFDDQLFQTAREVGQANVDRAQLATISARHAARPSVLLNATISRTRDGDFVAFIGGDDPNTAVAVGRSDTVIGALDALDRVLEPKKYDQQNPQ